ncbi:MAG: polysaccharide deacetylase family protein [Massiliimalia sp.]|jgi:peptidoglycan/xylan/chitin deacetylase (PgdA/CDA1 family)
MKIIKKILLCCLTVLISFVYVGCEQTKLSSPSEITVSLKEDFTVDIQWTETEDEIGYRLYRKSEADDDYQFLVDVSQCFFHDTTVDDGNIYTYKVSALYSHGESQGTQSSPIEVVDLENQQADGLSVPVITSVTPMDKYTNVILFEDNNTDCVYQIFRSDTENGPYKKIGRTELKVFYDDSAAGACYYQVTAVDNQEESQLSLPVLSGTNAQQVWGVPVIMYHEFLTEEDLNSGVLFDEYAIYREEFEEDLIWLKQNGYTPITTKELCDFLEGRSMLPQKPIILTIDDGKYGVYKTAYPLLKQYGMKAVLAVIGDQIQLATEDPVKRVDPQAPYCTWDEIAEMSHSGYVEIISHTYGLHVFHHENRQGANTAEGETAGQYSSVAYKDYRKLLDQFEKYDIPTPAGLCYPYSIRSIASDKAWINCGYQILYGGNSDEVRKSQVNYFVQQAGLNLNSSLLRRIVRMHEVPLSDYIADALYEE